MNHKLKKIHILGGSGAGKTYLSKKLSKELNIKKYDLDNIVWSKKSKYYDIQVPITEKHNELNKILQNNSWIIDGVYYDWVFESFKKADLIILLKPSVFLRDFRVIKRFVLKKLGLYKTGKKERLKDLISLLKWNHYYEKVRITETLKCVKPFKTKTIFFNSADEAFENIIKN